MTSAFHGFRMLFIAIIAPLIFAVAAVAVSLALAASGPQRIVTHWDLPGRPDGYGSPYSYPILIASLTVALIVLLGGLSVLVSHRSAMTVMIKILGVTSLWVTLMLGVGLIGVMLGQRTAAAVATAQGPGLALLTGVGIATIVAVGAWFVLPKAERSPSDADAVAVAPVVLADGERASWIRTAAASRGILLVFVAVGVLVGGAEVIVVTTTDGQFWWFSFIPIAVLIIVLSNLAWTVRVDARGVRMRSVIGFPSISIPLSNVTSANVVDIQAFSQFGGWGIRWNLAGRVGIILRSGEALEVHRHKGLVVVITVDDATSAAALINGLVQREVKVG